MSYPWCVVVYCGIMRRIYFMFLLTNITYVIIFFFLMIRRPPRSTLDRSSAASDVYKRQDERTNLKLKEQYRRNWFLNQMLQIRLMKNYLSARYKSVSYTHLRAHETVLDLVCRLLLETKTTKYSFSHNNTYIT